MCEQKGSSQNIASKLVEKVTRKESETVLKSWTEPLINRRKSTEFLYERTWKFWIVSYLEEYLCADKLHTEILLHVKNYNKLQ